MRRHSLSIAALLPVIPLAVVLGAGCSSSSSPASPGPNDTGDAGPVDANSTVDANPTNDANMTATDAGTCPSKQFVWATSGGGPGQYDQVSGVAADSEGNVWVTGTFIGSATWGSFQLSSADTTHTSGFVAKLDPTGKVLIARALLAGAGGTNNTTIFGARIRVDAVGDAYVTGGYSKQLDLDDVHLMETNAGNGSAFLLKLNGSTGVAVWGATSNDGGDGESASDLTVDSNGDVYITGQYNGAVQFGTNTVTGVSSDKAVFVAKYSATARDWIWAKGWAGQQNSTNDGGVGTGIVATSDGNLYVTGIVDGTIGIDGTVLTNDGGSFVAKLGSFDGHVAWVTPLTPDASMDTVEAESIAVDSTNNAYVTGSFKGTPTFSTPSLTADGGAEDASAPISVATSYGGDDMFLVKYDPNGYPAWVEHAGATGNALVARGDDVAVEGTSVYVSGFSQGPTTFASQKLSLSGTPFVAKYDTAGTIQWVQGTSASGSDSSEAHAIAVPSATSGVFIGGSYVGTETFGSIPLTSSGQDDAFVATLCN
jgi:hypothetical protein